MLYMMVRGVRHSPRRCTARRMHASFKSVRCRSKQEVMAIDHPSRTIRTVIRVVICTLHSNMLGRAMLTLVALICAMLTLVVLISALC